MDALDAAGNPFDDASGQSISQSQDGPSSVGNPFTDSRDFESTGDLKSSVDTSQRRHAWRPQRFGNTKNRCFYCRERVGGRQALGYACTQCGNFVHEECQILVPLRTCIGQEDAQPPSDDNSRSTAQVVSTDEPTEPFSSDQAPQPQTSTSGSPSGVERMMLLQRSASVHRMKLCDLVKQRGIERRGVLRNAASETSAANPTYGEESSDESEADIDLITDLVSSHDQFMKATTQFAQESGSETESKEEDVVDFSDDDNDTEALPHHGTADELWGAFLSEDIRKQCLLPANSFPSSRSSSFHFQHGNTKSTELSANSDETSDAFDQTSTPSSDNDDAKMTTAFSRKGAATTRIKSAFRFDSAFAKQPSGRSKGSRSFIPQGWLSALARDASEVDRKMIEHDSRSDDSSDSIKPDLDVDAPARFSEIRSSSLDAFELKKRSTTDAHSSETSPTSDLTLRDNQPHSRSRRSGSRSTPAPRLSRIRSETHEATFVRDADRMQDPVRTRSESVAIPSSALRPDGLNKPRAFDQERLHHRLLSRSLGDVRQRSGSVVTASPPKSTDSSPALALKKQENLWLAHSRKRSGSSSSQISQKSFSKPDEAAVLNIQAQLSKGEFMPGERLRGKVFLDCIQPLLHTSRVRVIVQGFERAFEGLAASQLARAAGAEGQHGKLKYSSKMFFHDVVTVWQPTEDMQTLDSGQYVWSFKMKLPINLPPTAFFEDWCSIFYQVRAYCEPKSDAFEIANAASYTHAIRQSCDSPIIDDMPPGGGIFLDEASTQVKSDRKKRKNKHPLSELLTSKKAFFDLYSVHPKLWERVVLRFSQEALVEESVKGLDVKINTLVRSDFAIGEEVPVQVRVDLSQFADGPIQVHQIRLKLIQATYIHLDHFRCQFDDIVVAELVHNFPQATSLSPGQTFSQIVKLTVPAGEVQGSELVVPSTTGLLWTCRHVVNIVLSFSAGGKKSSIFQSSKNKSKLELPIRIWDSLWNSPLGGDGDREEADLPLPQNPADFRFKTLQIWSRPFLDLPVLKDLPRLAHRIRFVVLSASATDPDMATRKAEFERIIETYSYLTKYGQSTTLSSPTPRQLQEIVLGVVVTLVALLEGQRRADTLISEFWILVGQRMASTLAEESQVIAGGASTEQFSRLLGHFFEQHVGLNSPAARILKACNQAVVAPAVIELSTAIMKESPFKDGGSWKIEIGLFPDRSGRASRVVVSHAKSQVSLEKTDDGTSPRFSFEWELDLNFMSSSDFELRECTFGLRAVDFADGITSGERRHVSSILAEFFDRSSVLMKADHSNEQCTHSNLKAAAAADAITQQKRHRSLWVPSTHSAPAAKLRDRSWLMLLPPTIDDPFDCLVGQVGSTFHSPALALRRLIASGDVAASYNHFRSLKLQQLGALPSTKVLLKNPTQLFYNSVAAWYGVPSSLAVRELDRIGRFVDEPKEMTHSAAQIQTLNLNGYEDKDAALFEIVATQLKCEINLHDRVRRKLMMPFGRLLVAPTLPLISRYVAVSTTDGMLRRSSSDAFALGKEIEEGSEGSNLKSLLETISVLLHDSSGLEQLISNFSAKEAMSPAYLSRFFKEHMNVDAALADEPSEETTHIGSTVRLLRCFSLNLMALAFARVRNFFSRSQKEKFAVVDIARSWRTQVDIGRGDGSPEDCVVITHYKCAKSVSLDALMPPRDAFRNDGGFEILWQFRLVWSFDVRHLRAVQIRIAAVQPASPRFSTQRFRELVALCSAFNVRDDALTLPLPPHDMNKLWTGPGSDFIQDALNKADSTASNQTLNMSKLRDENTFGLAPSFAARKRMRQRLQRVVQMETSCPTLMLERALSVEIVEGVGIGKTSALGVSTADLLAAESMPASPGRRIASAHGSWADRRRRFRRSLSITKSPKISSKPPSLYATAALVGVNDNRSKTPESTFICGRSNDPVWQERIQFKVDEMQTQHLRIFVYDSTRSVIDENGDAQDAPLAFAEIPISAFTDLEVHDEWFELQSVRIYEDAVLAGLVEPLLPGRIRLRLSFNEDVILPLALYSEFHEVITKTPERAAILLDIGHRACMLSSSSTQDHTGSRTNRAHHILFTSCFNILADKGAQYALDVLWRLCDEHIARATFDDVVERRLFALETWDDADVSVASAAAHASRAYFWLFGKNYISQMLQPIVRKIVEHDTLTSLDANAGSPKVRNKHATKLQRLLAKLVDTLIESRHAVPEAIRTLLAMVDKRASARWKELLTETRVAAATSGRQSPTLSCGFDMSTIAMGNLIIGLLIAPALADPVSYGIFEGVVPRNARHTLRQASQALRQVGVGQLSTIPASQGLLPPGLKTEAEAELPDVEPMFSAPRLRQNSTSLVSLNVDIVEQAPRVRDFLKFLALPRTETDSFAGFASDSMTLQAASATHARVFLERELAAVHVVFRRLRLNVLRVVSDEGAEAAVVEQLIKVTDELSEICSHEQVVNLSRHNRAN